jgi:hypothetical protein
MIRFMLTALALALSGAALAKIPAPTLDEAAKAKAAETAAKTAWQAKVDAYQLCKAQDRVVAYVKSHPVAKSAAAAGTAPAAPAAAAAPTAAPAAAAAATMPVPTAATASQGGSTPNPAVTSALMPVPPCGDPGPFAFTPPEQKPLETSGAHSPAGTASSPPSVRAEAATMTPAKPGTATKK